MQEAARKTNLETERTCKKQRETEIETRRDSHGNLQRETLIEVRDRDLQKQNRERQGEKREGQRDRKKNTDAHRDRQRDKEGVRQRE